MFGLADPWLWLIAAAALAIAEMIMPGVFLIWIGGAAAFTGIAAFLLPIGSLAQVILFAVASVAAIYAGKRIIDRNPIATADPLLNDKGGRMVGMIVTAAEPIDALGGRVKAGDSIWSARGTDAQPGDRLRVRAVEGTILIVEPA